MIDRSPPPIGGWDFLCRQDSIPKGQLALDALALLPLIGGLNDSVDAVKATKRTADAANTAGKALDNGDEITSVGGDITKKMLDATETVGYSKISSLKTTQGLTMSRNGFAHLLVDISENGIQEPIKYVSIGDTRYVVDGHHRLYATKKLGLESVPTEEVTLPYKGYKTTDDLFW